MAIIEIPFKCPVCGGNGIVPNGFYGQTSGIWDCNRIEPEMCQSCEGSGIVWRTGTYNIVDLSGTIKFEDGMDNEE